jgi:hypothetical protein
VWGATTLSIFQFWVHDLCISTPLVVLVRYTRGVRKSSANFLWNEKIPQTHPPEKRPSLFIEFVSLYYVARVRSWWPFDEAWPKCWVRNARITETAYADLHRILYSS